MQANAYLMFNGNCEEAFKFYEKCFGGKILAIMTYGSSPMASKTPPDFVNRIMHARLDVGGTIVMGSDAPPGRTETPQGFSMAIGMKDVAEAERVYAELSEGGKVEMPLQQTFWAVRFGMLTDRFGIPWMVNCEAAANAASGQ